MSHTNIIKNLGKTLNPIINPLFNVPGIAGFAIIMGIISGAPIGAKIITDFKKKNLCTQEEANHLLIYTNNSGPLFIIGAVGISLFKSTQIGLILFISQLLSCITFGIISGFISRYKTSFSRNKRYVSSASIPNNNSLSLGEILTSSIINSINTILLIGGFIVLFNVIISILENSKILYLLSLFFKPIFNLLHLDFSLILPFVSGIFEITNGLQDLSAIGIKEISTILALCSFLIGFGGLSIATQVLGIISKTGLSIKKYILGKFFLGIINSFYTYIFFTKIPFFNLDIETVFSSQTSKISTSLFSNIDISYIYIFITFTIIILISQIIKPHLKT